MCVTNGRADGPAVQHLQHRRFDFEIAPLMKCCRSDRLTTLRSSTVRRACGRTMKSTYRCRTRLSSESGLCATGSGRNALAVIAQESARTDSSPRREVITVPCTNRWSPRSTSALECGQRIGTDAGQRHHHLQFGAGVARATFAQGRKTQLAGVPQEDDPAGDTDDFAGIGVRRQVGKGAALAPLRSTSGRRRPDRAGPRNPAAAAASPAALAAVRAGRRPRSGQASSVRHG